MITVKIFPADDANKDLEFETAMPGDWSFWEAKAVKRITGLRAGDVWFELISGDAMASLALAIVGHMRAKPDVDVDYLADLKIHKIVVDLGDGKTSEEGGDRPPADGAAEAPPADER